MKATTNISFEAEIITAKEMSQPHFTAYFDAQRDIIKYRLRKAIEKEFAEDFGNFKISMQTDLIILQPNFESKL